ncbi:MAG: carbohydrate binding family 9 domain-containing protein [Cyclobacteriaceae bacterium]|nr:carbohydrate binding family 9 domain-containing protein [Cyclobacteriaceae bacterium]
MLPTPSIIFLWAALVATTCFGQDSAYLNKPPIVIARTTGLITVDGPSHEPAWRAISSVPFIVLEPVWGAPPTERTELRLAYDDQFLYLAGRCFTRDSSTIIARNLVRDGYRGDDWMTIHFDSRFDRQNAFVFSVYPLGSRYDMAMSNDAVELGNATFNPAFNMFWEAKTVINKDGWFFEMKIPLYNLRYKPNNAGNIEMGISATRAIQYRQEYHQFPAVPRHAIEPIMKPSLKQPVVFLNLPKPNLFLLTPYVLAGTERRNLINESETGIVRQTSPYFQAGLDAKIGVSPYLTLDASINPDFAQVEADDQLINLTRFSLFFPERRLFFQEQAGLFEFSLGGDAQLFYSRRIGINEGQLTDIYGGLRLTGKLTQKLDIGLLNMQAAPTDLANGTRVPTENYGVLRLRQKVLNNRSFVGAMVTSRLRSGKQSYAYGLDALLNPAGTQYLLVNAAYHDVVGQPGGADASRVNLLWENRRTDRFFHKIGYTYSGKNFNPEVGFVDRSNIHNPWWNIDYGKFATERKGKFQYKRYTLLAMDSYIHAENGMWESNDIGMGWRGTTFKGTQWSGQLNVQYEYLATSLDFGNGVVIPPGGYHFARVTLGFTPPRFKGIRVPVRAIQGGFYDGSRLNLNASPTFNLGKHWEIQATYDYTHLRFEPRNLYKHVHLARVRVAYALDLHLSINLTVQYNSSVNQFFNNTRLRYNFKDGHDFYLVWNENLFAERRYNEQIMRPLSGTQTFLVKYYYTFLPFRPTRKGR